jgi:hypothetical protein
VVPAVADPLCTMTQVIECAATEAAGAVVLDKATSQA